MTHVLIIEDDIGISDSLQLYLENSNYTVDILESGEKAVEKCISGKYQLIILDINLPVKDGITICKEVRAVSDVPIIMLTARTGEFDRINGLEIWADDYVSKPFSPRELIARIQNILKRTQIKNIHNTNIIIWDIEIDLKKLSVTKSNIPLNFTKNEFDILKSIAEKKWEIITRESLMTDVIGYENYAFDRTIDTHIKNIRKKLWNKDIILTIRGVWYRINM